MTKQRRLITIPYADRGDTGCRVELTNLRTGGERWSTVGFESFGPEPDLVPALTAAAARFFGSLDLPGGLGPALSCGYPGWLTTL